jgi:hypothetical protein
LRCPPPHTWTDEGFKLAEAPLISLDCAGRGVAFGLEVADIFLNCCVGEVADRGNKTALGVIVVPARINFVLSVQAATAWIFPRG